MLAGVFAHKDTVTAGQQEGSCMLAVVPVVGQQYDLDPAVADQQQTSGAAFPCRLLLVLVVSAVASLCCAVVLSCVLSGVETAWQPACQHSSALSARRVLQFGTRMGQESVFGLWSEMGGVACCVVTDTLLS
jgi:hypothetical protein